MKKSLHIDCMRKVGVFTPSRVAPQGLLDPVPALFYDGTGFLFFPSRKIMKGDRKMSTEKIPYKIYLDESEMPKSWYNLRADMKNKPAPLLNPQL